MSLLEITGYIFSSDLFALLTGCLLTLLILRKSSPKINSVWSSMIFKLFMSPRNLLMCATNKTQFVELISLCIVIAFNHFVPNAEIACPFGHPTTAKTNIKIAISAW